MRTEIRYAHHPDDVKKYDTERLRREFLIEELFIPDEICLTYSFYDRYIVGGIMPVKQQLSLESFDELRASYFLYRRELGIINTGGHAKVMADGTAFELSYKEALYLGKETQNVSFTSSDPENPAKLYFNSAPAHQSYPCKKITVKEAEVVSAGSQDASNHRTIHKLLINSIVQTCGLQMGLTTLHTGNVWNTMPPHTHSRRMEAYFYFEVPENQAICHFMGQPDETRHLWMHNNQAVISPPWSIHSAAGTSGYSFIWGMTGENLDYGDMDIVQPNELK